VRQRVPPGLQQPTPAKAAPGSRSTGVEPAPLGGDFRGQPELGETRMATPSANRQHGGVALGGRPTAETHRPTNPAGAPLCSGRYRCDMAGRAELATSQRNDSREPVHLVTLVNQAGSATPKKTLHATERETAVNQEKRPVWREQITEFDPARLVFVDESGVTRSMTRRYGRAPQGERVPGAAPLGHWEVTHHSDRGLGARWRARPLQRRRRHGRRHLSGLGRRSAATGLASR
jgi:hypothetical protein